MNNTSLIIRREYLERVKKKSFIVTTLLVPLFMLLMAVLPTAIMLLAPSETKTVVVIDDSGIVSPRLENTDDVKFISAWAPQNEMLSSDSIYGLLVIDRNIMANNSAVRILTPNAASITVENTVTAQMEKIIENEKLKKYDIRNLDNILADVKTDVTLQSIRVDDSGSDNGESQSAAFNSIVGTMLNLILYMFLLMYGSQVMNSIVEEKNNRVLEIVVSSVKPMQLMLGKIVGVGLVALTQVIIWGMILTLISSLILPAMLPADMIAEAAAINSGTGELSSTSMDVDLARALGTFTNVGYIMQVFGLLILFLIGGYLLYAAIFAAIGASVDNLQDASQLQTVGVLPIIIGIIASMAIIPDPNSSFSIVMSLIPLTSPMVMMARVPFGIPAWQVASSLALLVASIIVTIWLAAKIYRVGIFMYGKKPTVRDLIRWARYK